MSIYQLNTHLRAFSSRRPSHMLVRSISIKPMQLKAIGEDCQHMKQREPLSPLTCILTRTPLQGAYSGEISPGEFTAATAKGGSTLGADNECTITYKWHHAGYEVGDAIQTSWSNDLFI